MSVPSASLRRSPRSRSGPRSPGIRTALTRENLAENAPWVAVAGVLAIVAGVLVDVMPLVPLGLLGVATAVSVYLAVPALALAALLVLRPILESVAEQFAFGGVNILGMMGAGTVVGGAAYLAIRRPRLPRTVVILSVCLVALAVASLGWTISRERGISDVLGFALYPVVFGVAASTIRDPRGFHRLVKVLLLAAVAPILVGLFQLATGDRVVKEGYASIQGPMVHPNSFALFLMVALTLGVVAFMRTPDRRLRRYLAIGLLLGAACFFFTYARAAWGGLLGVAAMLAFLEYRRLLGFGLIAVILLAVAFPSVTSQVTGRFADLSPTSTGYSNNSLSWRTELWQRMLPYGYDKPVLGHGVGSFLPLTNVEIGVFDYRFQNATNSAANIEVYPHNDYLLLFVELGVLGVVFWFGLLVASGVIAWRARRHPQLREYAVGVTGLIIALLAISATDNVKDTESVLIGIFALVGGLYGASRGRPAEHPVDDAAPAAADRRSAVLAA